MVALRAQLFADLVDVTFDLGRTFYGKLSAAEDFLPARAGVQHRVFRHMPAGLRNTRTNASATSTRTAPPCIESGEFYIVPAKHDGVGALRVTLINPLTTPEHLDRLMDAASSWTGDANGIAGARFYDALTICRAAVARGSDAREANRWQARLFTRWSWNQEQPAEILGSAGRGA